MINTDWPSGRKDAVLTVNGVTVADELRSVTYKDDLNGDSGAVMLGSATAAQLVLVIDGPSVTYTDAELTLSLGGVPLGVFHVSRTEQRGSLITVTAFDAMAGDAMLLTYTPGAASTALGVIREIADAVGLSFAATTGGETILTEAEAELTAENGDALVTDGVVDVAVTPPAGRTRREMLGLMAALLGRNAHIDRYGHLTLRWYADAAWAVTPDDIYADGLAMEDSDFTIGRIECSVTTTTATAETDDDGNTTTAETTETTVLTAGSGTTGISLADDAMTQETLEAVYAEIGGMSFRPMQAVIYGDARIETGDLITVTDLQGAAHAVPVMAVTHTWDGGIKTTITAVGKPSETLGSAGGTLSKAVDNLALEFARFKNLEAENLRAQNAKFENVEAKKLVVLDADGNIVFRADAGTHVAAIGGFTVEADRLASDKLEINGSSIKCIGDNTTDGFEQSAYLTDANLVWYANDGLGTGARGQVGLSEGASAALVDATDGWFHINSVLNGEGIMFGYDGGTLEKWFTMDTYGLSAFKPLWIYNDDESRYVPLNYSLARALYSLVNDSITYTAWEGAFVFRADTATTRITLPAASLEDGTLSGNTVNWTFAPINGTAFYASVTPTSIAKDNPDVVVVQFDNPDSMPTGGAYGICVPRGDFTIMSA